MEIEPPLIIEEKESPVNCPCKYFRLSRHILIEENERGGIVIYCRLNELRSKYVINVRNGCKLGYLDDIEIDTASAGVRAIIIKGRLRLLGLLGREEDIVIPWEDIEVIGEDTILINRIEPLREGRRSGQKLFHILTED